MNGTKLESVQCVKNLGVTVASTLKFSRQCKDATGKANRMLGFINRNFSFKNKDLILPLQVWVLHHAKYIGKIGAVQRRATKMITSLRNKPCEENNFLLFSNWEVREVTADLKGVYVLKKVKNHWVRIRAFISKAKSFLIQLPVLERNTPYKGELELLVLSLQSWCPPPNVRCSFSARWRWLINLRIIVIDCWVRSNSRVGDFSGP